MDHTYKCKQKTRKLLEITTGENLLDFRAKERALELDT